MIAEEFRIGGTCVIRGCVPKKLLVYASRFADAFADAEAFGWSVGETSFDWPTLVAAKEKEIRAVFPRILRRQSDAKLAGRDLRERATVAGPNAVALLGGRESPPATSHRRRRRRRCPRVDPGA